MSQQEIPEYSSGDILITILSRPSSHRASETLNTSIQNALSTDGEGSNRNTHVVDFKSSKHHLKLEEHRKDGESSIARIKFQR